MTAEERAADVVSRTYGRLQDRRELRAEIAIAIHRAEAEMQERCAVVAEWHPLKDHEDDYRDVIAAAIRGLK